MLALGLEQVQVVFQRFDLQRPGFGGGGGVAFDGGAVGDIDAVHVLYEIHDFRRLHIVGEPAAKLGGKIKLAVGKCTGAAEAAHGIAGLTVNAGFHLACHNGTFPGIDVFPLFHNDNIKFRMQLLQFVAGKDPGLAAANDGNICLGLHNEGSPSKSKVLGGETLSTNFLL